MCEPKFGQSAKDITELAIAQIPRPQELLHNVLVEAGDTLGWTMEALAFLGSSWPTNAIMDPWELSQFHKP